VAISDGSLYTLGYEDRNDTVYCLDAATGKVKWKHSYPSTPGQYTGPKSTPTVDNGKVYTLSRSGALFCFDKENGKVLWQKDIEKDFSLFAPQWGYAGSPVIRGDMLLLNAGESGLALDKNSGKKIWASKAATTGGYATPVLFPYEGIQHAALFSQTGLYVIEVESGKQLASYGWRTGYDVNAADPIVVGNRIFITSNYGKGCALLEFKGKELVKIWSNTDMAAHFSSPIYLNGYIYGHDADARYRGNLRCLDAKTGKTMWTERLGMVSIIALDDKLLILDEKGILRVLEASPSSYTELAQSRVLTRTNWTPPVFVEGLIYCRNAIGDLVSVDVRK
jgi:outer membrane protein assembly factor BamB